MNDDIKKLELRITELENQLKSAGGAAAKIDPEDMKTFQKVSQQLGISGCINECQPSICHSCSTCYSCFVCHACIKVCINECVCGPCILTQAPTLGGARFGSLG